MKPARVGAGPPGGFTLVEMMFSVAVIALLISLLIVGLRVAMRVSRKAVEQQAVASLMIGVEQFKHDFGFVPPLIEDGDPDAPDFSSMGPDNRKGPLFPPNGTSEPVAFLSTTDMAPLGRFVSEERYLRGRDPANENTPLTKDYRFSTYSLAYYLLGALGKDSLGNNIDGVDGAGFMTPNRDGTFRKTGGKKYDPLFDTTKGTRGVVEVDGAAGKYELRDRRGVAYRYYVWRQGRMDNGKLVIEEPADLNIPRLLGDSADDPQLRSAQYAIVAPGANGVFGDWVGPGPDDGTETPTEIKDGMGVSQGMNDDRAARMGREDNIVQVGK